ncbi:MAG: hypothetical protein AAF716_03330 [Cyanobacteria bacterium P01_D01_bin.1]
MLTLWRYSGGRNQENGEGGWLRSPNDGTDSKAPITTTTYAGTERKNKLSSSEYSRLLSRY